MTSATTPKPVILIIDDNITNLKVAIEHLQVYSFEILTARTGEAGLTRAQEARPDLILLDVQMPGIDGFETCRRLKANAHTTDIPVIFMTALSESEDKVRGLEAGAVDYVVKPLDAAELMARVNTHLKMRTLQAQLRQLNAELTALVAQLEQRNQEMNLLSTLSEVIQTCQTTDEAFAAIRRYVARLLPHESGALYLLAPSRNLLEAAAHWGELPLDSAFFTPDECWALRRGRVHTVNNVRTDLPCPHAASASAYVCAPMMAGGEALGILYTRSGNGELSHATQQLAVSIAERLALSLSNLKLRETLRQQSIRDPLTGLFNRRYLEETLEREVYRATRSGAPVGIIMLDVDYFKRVNDTFGHEAGDAVLQAVGQLLRTHVRAEDIPCRYGGEEFTLILPGASVEVAAQRAEALRAKAEGLQVSAAGQPLGDIRLSLGVAVLPVHGATGLGVLQAADAALYQAKHAGRNRVVVA